MIVIKYFWPLTRDNQSFWHTQGESGNMCAWETAKLQKVPMWRSWWKSQYTNKLLYDSSLSFRKKELESRGMSVSSQKLDKVLCAPLVLLVKDARRRPNTKPYQNLNRRLPTITQAIHAAFAIASFCCRDKRFDFTIVQC